MDSGMTLVNQRGTPVRMRTCEPTAKVVRLAVLVTERALICPVRAHLARALASVTDLARTAPDAGQDGRDVLARLDFKGVRLVEGSVLRLLALVRLVGLVRDVDLHDLFQLVNAVQQRSVELSVIRSRRRLSRGG